MNDEGMWMLQWYETRHSCCLPRHHFPLSRRRQSFEDFHLGGGDRFRQWNREAKVVVSCCDKSRSDFLAQDSRRCAGYQSND